MESLCAVCVRITEEYKKYKFIYSNTEKETFTCLKKFSKALESLGEDHEVFTESCKRFWDKNKENFSGKNWEDNVVKFQLYNENKPVKNCALFLSQISYLAEEVDKQKPTKTKMETMKSKLDQALFKLISKIDENFVKTISMPEQGALPFDMSKLSDVLGKIIESGVIPGSESVDKKELMNTVNSFVSNPKINEVLGSVAQVLTNKDSTIDPKMISDIFSSVEKKE